MATESDTSVNAVSESLVSPTSDQGRSQDGSEYSIPTHLFGRTVDNPAADIVGAVKTHQKPRLGVRVPYLNLTSQIVSQDEIAAELAERAQKKNPIMADGNKMGDMFFTMKMTHRLVKSIKPVFPEKGQISDQQLSAAEADPLAPDPTQLPEGGTAKESVTIVDPNSFQSQLMETLENDCSSLDETIVEPMLSRKDAKRLKPLRKPRVHVPLDRELERQLALQQLQEFNVQKELKKELKIKIKEEQKEVKSKEQKPKKRSRRFGKLKNIKVNRKLDETEAPILPYKSLPRKHKITMGVVPVNGADTTPKITANVNEVTEAPPEVPDINIEKDNRYVKKYTNKRYSEDAMNGANEIIDELASGILNPSPKKKFKKIKTPPNKAVKENTASTGKRKSGRKITLTEKVASQNPAPAVVANGLISADHESQLQENQTVEDGVMETEIKAEAESLSQEPIPDMEGGKKSRMMREIDRLLMDEGAINMLHSIQEKRSPKNKEKANLLPSSRRKKKDLLLKTKLVKSAVLKLSGSPKQVSNRVLRQSNKHDEAEPDQSRKASVDSQESAPGASPKPSSSLPAEASRIIRRHSSSSSFSSTAGSPRRVSTDFEHPLPNLTPDAASTSGKKPKKKGSANKPKRTKDPLAPTSSPAVKTAKDTESTSNQAAAGKMSAPVKNDVRTEMSKNFNKKASSPKNVIRKTLYAEEKSSLSSPAVVATASSSAMPPPQEQSSPAATSTPAPRTSTPQQIVNASHNKKSSALFLETLANKEFNEKLERLDKMQVRLPPSTPIMPKLDCYREITIQKYDTLMHIVLTPVTTKVKNALNIRILRELLVALQQANADKSCRVVLLTSMGATFCQGIDFEYIVEDDPEKRKIVVVELAMALRDFIHGLGMFNKLLVAGVHGPAVGLGVMMLPYFDMVFASDKATFYTPYTKLGQAPEGAPALSMANMLSNAATSELIYGCRQLTAGEALRCGLVTRILWPDRFQEELLPIVAEISTHSAQAMEATKTLMRKDIRAHLNMALAAECHLLVKNWNTTECQENFKKFLKDDSFWQITK